MHTIPRRAAFLIALAGLGLVSGCTALSDINPFDRGSNEPLPPVQGNVIATSSSSDLQDRLGTAGQADTTFGESADLGDDPPPDAALPDDDDVGAVNAN